MKTFYYKTFLLFSLFFAAFNFYITLRLKQEKYLKEQSKFGTLLSCPLSNDKKLQNLRNFWGHFLPITIKYSTSSNIEDQAQTLFNSTRNFYDFYTINLCHIRERSDTCKTIDIRLFLHEYFKVTKSTFIQDKAPLLSYYGAYYFKRDVDISSCFDNRVKVLGGMFALAQITNAFIEMNFHKFVLNGNFANQKNNLEALRFIDKDQYDIYTETKAYCSNYTFLLGPSPKPFIKPSPYSSYNMGNIFAKSDTLDLAADRILTQPYLNSRRNFFEGFHRYLDFESTDTYNVDSIDLCNLDEKKFVSAWKYHSVCKSYNCNDFWGAMYKLKRFELIHAYNKISGYRYFPEGGFGRFPKLQLVSFNDRYRNDFIPERFKVNLKNYSTSDEIYYTLKNLENDTFILSTWPY